jgi:hypothetical protein
MEMEKTSTKNAQKGHFCGWLTGDAILTDYIRYLCPICGRPLEERAPWSNTLGLSEKKVRGRRAFHCPRGVNYKHPYSCFLLLRDGSFYKFSGKSWVPSVLKTKKVSRKGKIIGACPVSQS